MKDLYTVSTKVIVNSDDPCKDDKYPRWTCWIAADSFNHEFRNIFVQTSLDANNPIWSNGHMKHKEDCECHCCDCREKHCECSEYGD